MVILLLPIFLKSVQVVSTENPVIIPKQEVYLLTHGPYHFLLSAYYRISKILVVVLVYSTEDLIKESGKMQKQNCFRMAIKIAQGQPVLNCQIINL